MERIKETEWKLTDPDTNQYGRQLNNLEYEFKEDGKDIRLINLLDYTSKEIEECINTYGYTMYITTNKLKNVSELYGNDANWIIAECLFECDL